MEVFKIHKHPKVCAQKVQQFAVEKLESIRRANVGAKGPFPFLGDIDFFAELFEFFEFEAFQYTSLSVSSAI
jgi:hypothetical protein